MHSLHSLCVACPRRAQKGGQEAGQWTCVYYSSYSNICCRDVDVEFLHTCFLQVGAASACKYKSATQKLGQVSVATQDMAATSRIPHKIMPKRYALHLKTIFGVEKVNCKIFHFLANG
jgi:hypothetical protein